MSALLALLLSAAWAAPATAAKPDMSRPPALGKPKPYAAPARVSWGLPNGLRVIYVESPRAPLLTLRLGVRGGTALGGERDAGLVEAMAGLLAEGTEAKTALEQAEAAEAAGGSLGAYAAEDYTAVWAQGLAGKADELLALFKETALSPAFAEAEVALRKETMLAELKLRRAEPSWLAGAAAGRAFYGAHAYGVPGPNEASIARIGRDGLRALHRKLFQPQNAVLVAVGALPVSEFRPKADALFSDWAGRPELPQPPPPSPQAPAAAEVRFVPKPGLEQAVLVFGLAAPREDEPAYEALLVANMVFGGSYGARLNNDLREDKGWTYGVYSSLESLRAGGGFWVQGQFRADSARRALDAFRAHLKRLAAAPPTATELERAKANLVSALTFSFESQAGVADRLLRDAMMQLSDSRLDGLVGRIQAVTAAQAQAAAKRWLSGGDFVVGVCADPAVKEKLDGYAPLVVAGPDGLPL